MSIECEEFLNSFDWETFSQNPLQNALFLKASLEERFTDLLFSSDNFSQLASQFAWLGTKQEKRSLLEKEIVQLFSAPEGIKFKNQDGQILPAKNFFTKCWKEYKTEIIIGIAVLAIITTVVIVSTCTGGSGAAPAAVAGAAALDTLQNVSQNETPPPKKESPIPSPPPPKGTTSLEKLFTDLQPPAQEWPKIYATPPDLALPPPRPFIDPEAKIPPHPLRLGEKSSTFQTSGPPLPPHCRIGVIPGINNLPENARDHAERFSHYAQGHCIEGIDNSTHSPIVDVAEAFFLNYRGVATPPSSLLKENWEKFHKENAQNSEAKYLQFCHSQGAIHVKNALRDSPPEIRGRVVIVAIAPAAVIPKTLCHDSYNYASKRDLVPFGEIVTHAAINPLQAVIDFEDLQELILLEPHPDAPNHDHAFDSPTFEGVIKRHIHNYLNDEEEK